MNESREIVEIAANEHGRLILAAECAVVFLPNGQTDLFRFRGRYPLGMDGTTIGEGFRAGNLADVCIQCENGEIRSADEGRLKAKAFEFGTEIALERFEGPDHTFPVERLQEVFELLGGPRKPKVLAFERPKKRRRTAQPDGGSDAA